MNDSQTIRSVVSRFFNVPESEVTEAFPFPAERLQGSVGRATLHAALKRLAGVDLPSAFTANTYGQLLHASAQPRPVSNGVPATPAPESGPDFPAIGIDIEHAANLSWPGDPRSEPFYVENFTGAEIAYCLRQPDSKLSFCGLWSAKEAAIKCGHEFAGLRPIEIEVIHEANNRPALRLANGSGATSANQWALSISHSGQTAVAVCVRVPQPIIKSAGSPPEHGINSSPDSRPTARAPGRLLLWFSLLLSFVAILLCLWSLRGR